MQRERGTIAFPLWQPKNFFWEKVKLITNFINEIYITDFFYKNETNHFTSGGFALLSTFSGSRLEIGEQGGAYF